MKKLFETFNGTIFTNEQEAINYELLNLSGTVQSPFIKQIHNQFLTGLNETSIVASTDNQGKIIEVNDQFCEISGYAKEELIGHNHRIINSGMHTKEFFREMWEMISSGRVWRGDIENRRKNGETYWVHTVIIPILNDHKIITRYMSIRFDITTKKLAELENQKLLLQHEEAQSLAKIGSWTFDLNTNFLHWSREHYKIFEIEEPQSQQNLYSLYRSRIHIDDLVILDELVEDAKINGKGFIFNHRLVFQDGRIKYVQGIGKGTHSQVGPRLTGTCQDFTERMEAKISLEKKEAFYNSILNSVEAEIAIINNEGVIVAVNAAWDQFSLDNGGGSSKVTSSKTGIGSNYINICRDTVLSDEQDHDGLNTYSGLRAVQNGDIPRFEMEYACHSPSEQRWFSLNISPLKSLDTEEQGLVVVYFNITERKIAEISLRESEIQLIQAAKLASLGELSAGIAHEINNPLAIILGSTELLVEFKDDPVFFGKQLNTIKKAGDRIIKIINGLKKFSHSSEGVLFGHFSLQNIIQDSMVLTESKAKRNNTNVSLVMTSEAFIFCNEIEISQVMVNLINNSLDAIKENVDRWIKIEVLKDMDAVVVKVTDSGHGIPEELRQKLFNPFFTTKGVGQGTGLGLSITKGILDQHRASIKVDPKCSNTCFEIRFPLIK